MRAMRDDRTMHGLRWWMTVLMVAGSIVPALAQGQVELSGRVVDLDGEPAADYRVVYRETSTFDVYLGGPTDADGRFTVSVPAGGSYAAVAVISPHGNRIELTDQPPLQGTAGASQEIRLAVSLAPHGVEVERFAGGDRLFLSFVEDPGIVAHWRGEGQLDYENYDFSDNLTLRGVGAAQFTFLRDVEVGARIGFGDYDPDGFSGGSGATDTDLWIKLRLSSDTGRAPDLALGAILGLPTGDTDSGLGFDAFGSKLFFAARWTVGWVAISAHVGVRATEDGEVFGVPLDGKTAGEAGAALIWPALAQLTVIIEGRYKGARFEGFDDDARLLAGVNWKPLPVGSFRLAASLGLADGAPDTQLIAGYAFDF